MHRPPFTPHLFICGAGLVVQLILGDGAAFFSSGLNDDDGSPSSHPTPTTQRPTHSTSEMDHHPSNRSTLSCDTNDDGGDGGGDTSMLQ